MALNSSKQFFTSLIYDIFVFLTKAKGTFCYYIKTSSLIFGSFFPLCKKSFDT